MNVFDSLVLCLNILWIMLTNDYIFFPHEGSNNATWQRDAAKRFEQF